MRPSLYTFAGGEPAFLALAAAHHARCLADPELNHPFSHADLNPAHVQRLAAYWAEVLGGPPRYSELSGDQSFLQRLHAGNGEVGDLGRQPGVVDRRDEARDEPPADPEFRAALRAYMEWAVADVLVFSPTDAVVPDGLPIPRWSWDGLQTA